MYSILYKLPLSLLHNFVDTKLDTTQRQKNFKLLLFILFIPFLFVTHDKVDGYTMHVLVYAFDFIMVCIIYSYFYMDRNYLEDSPFEKFKAFYRGLTNFMLITLNFQVVAIIVSLLVRTIGIMGV